MSVKINKVRIIKKGICNVGNVVIRLNSSKKGNCNADNIRLRLNLLEKEPVMPIMLK